MPKRSACGVGVDPLADRARRVAAAHGERLDQQVRERVQQHVRARRETGAWLLRSFVQRWCPLARPSSRCLTAGRASQLFTASARSWRKTPSPRFSTAGNHCGLERDLRALDVGLVLAVDVRRHGLEAREADERQDLAQAVELDHGLDAVAPLGAAPGAIGQPARVEVRIDRHVVAEALGRGEQRVELDLLDGPLVRLAALAPRGWPRGPRRRRTARASPRSSASS